MAEAFLSLPDDERREALLVAAERTGRPAYLLEKDIWVVWTLNALFEAPFGAHLVFKGGTSLSKACGGIIKRFSEDIDLTYSIRELIPGLPNGGSQESIPPSKSQAKKWTDAVRESLPQWITNNVIPTLDAALKRAGLNASLVQLEDGSKVELRYHAVTDGTAYVAEAVLLEFGARSTGEPAEVRSIACDAADALSELQFPVAHPRVMAVERTFWEKATAAHVYCLQGAMQPRYARHWYDLAQLKDAGVVEKAVADPALAAQVAQHKQMFFSMKAADGAVIQYQDAVTGGLVLVPEGDARAHLEADYKAMVDGGLIEDEIPPTFEQIMERCEAIARQVNDAMNRERG